jgi:hypothetical protein
MFLVILDVAYEGLANPDIYPQTRLFHSRESAETYRASLGEQDPKKRDNNGDCWTVFEIEVGDEPVPEDCKVCGRTDYHCSCTVEDLQD